MTTRLSPRVSLLIIASLFLLPLILAWLMYSGTIDYQPATTRNLGQLVTPPRAVKLSALSALPATGPSLEDLDEHWVVLHVVAADCGKDCLDAVAGLRQVHRAAGRNQSRVRLLLLLPPVHGQEFEEQLLAIYPSFTLAADPDDNLEPVLDEIAKKAEPPSPTAGGTYLIDPIGNIMMHYSAGSDPNHLKKDLKRLLTWSKLDEQ